MNTKNYFIGKILSSVKKMDEQRFGYLSLPRGFPVFTPEPETRMWLDFIPYRVSDPNHPNRDDDLNIATPGSLWYKRPFRVHRGVGINNKMIVCPTSIRKPCPICEYRINQRRNGAKWEEISPLRPSERNLYIVIPKRSKVHDEIPHIWNVSYHHFERLLIDELRENSDYEKFPSLEDGYTLKIRFDEQSIGGRRIAVPVRIDFEPRDYAYDSDILTKIPDLDKVLVIMDYKEIESIFFEGEVPESTQDESEDLEVTRWEPKVIPVKKKDVEEEEEDDIPLDDVKPAKRTTVKESSGKSNEKCPHGHRFGVDGDKFPECDRCSIWEDCTEPE